MDAARLILPWEQDIRQYQPGANNQKVELLGCWAERAKPKH